MLDLDSKDLRQILTQPKNALVKQYFKLFEIDGISLNFDDDALDYIVEKALEFKLGARGLRSICESILIDDMFNLPFLVLKKLLKSRLFNSVVFSVNNKNT